MKEKKAEFYILYAEYYFLLKTHLKDFPRDEKLLWRKLRLRFDVKNMKSHWNRNPS